MSAPTASELNRARNAALEAVRRGGWPGPVAVSVTLSGGAMTLRVEPALAPRDDSALDPRAEDPFHDKIQAAEADIRRRAKRAAR